MKPTVLLATTRRWPPVARLAMALAKSGFSVEAVCPPDHPITRTHATSRTFAYRGLSPVDSFFNAISAVDPDLVIPGDDLATQQLHALYFRERAKFNSGTNSICSILERSLGSPDNYRILHERSTVLQIAADLGLRVPKTAVVKDVSELRDFATIVGFPMVLKADGTSGGEGVRVVRSLDEAHRVMRTLHAPPLLARAIKRALIDHNTTLLGPSLRRTRSVVSAQSFVAGREATSLVACWEGRVLAALHFEVLDKGISAGPASVIRAIENVEMLNVAEKMVQRLGLSGLIGFDFMLEASTGNAYVIEINPRSTQVGHLTLGPGRDLPAALYAAVAGEALREGPRTTEKDTIALFPQEWTRDSESPYLKTAYHDVPWEEPELVNMCIKMSRRWTSRKSQEARIKAFWLLENLSYDKSQETSCTRPVIAQQGK